MDSVYKLLKLGDFRYMDEKVDFVVLFEKYYNIIKEEVDLNKIGIYFLCLFMCYNNMSFMK